MAAHTQQLVADLGLSEIARMQGCSVDTVRRHHAAWTRDRGFPAAVSLPGVRGPRWAKEAVLQWKLQAASGSLLGSGSGAGPAAGGLGSSTTDWAALAEARGALLDAGIHPDTMQPF